MAVTQPASVWTPPAGMSPAVVKGWRTYFGSPLLRKLGVTPEIYIRLYQAQGGRCHICRVARGLNPLNPRARGSRRLAVDHVHALEHLGLKSVRGLLCSGSLSADTCNRMIAHYDVVQLRRAVAYLESPPAWEILTGEEE